MEDYLKYIYGFLLCSALLLVSCDAKPPTIEKRIKSSTYEVIDLCNNPDLREVDSTVYPISTKQVTSFNVKFDKSKDSINVTFDFVAVCCQQFEMHHTVKRNIFKILYLPKENTETCECYCDYRARYTAIDSEIDYTKVRKVLIRRAKRTK